MPILDVNIRQVCQLLNGDGSFWLPRCKVKTHNLWEQVNNNQKIKTTIVIIIIIIIIILIIIIPISKFSNLIGRQQP